MNVILLGANGMAGHVMSRYLKEQGYGVLEHKGSRDFDLYSSYARERLANTRNAGIVVNCVGMLVKASEEHPDRAAYINGYLPHFLSAQFPRVIHISTDCVFNGKTGNYFPTSIPTERNMYGRTKAMGELINEKDCTIRTSIVGPEQRDANQPGLFHWFMSNEGEVTGWTKAVWNGVTTLELAKFVDRTIKENITGLVHIGCEPLNKYEMLQTMKKVYNTNHTIQATDGKAVDKTLVDFYDGYQPKTFEQLLEEQKEWYR